MSLLLRSVREWYQKQHPAACAWQCHPTGQVRLAPNPPRPKPGLAPGAVQPREGRNICRNRPRNNPSSVRSEIVVSHGRVGHDVASNGPPRVDWKRNKGRSGESILHFGLGRKKQIALLRSSKREGGSLLQICRSYRSCGEPLPMNLRGFIGKMNHKTVVGVSYGAWNIILGLFDK